MVVLFMLLLGLVVGYFYGIVVARRVLRRREAQAYEAGRQMAIAYLT